MKLLITLIMSLISSSVFANYDETTCLGKTLTGKSLNISIGENTVPQDDGLPSSFIVQIYLDGTLINTFYPEQIEKDLENYSPTENDYFVLPVLSGKNEQGFFKIYKAEQEPSDAYEVVLEKLQIKLPNATDNIIDLKESMILNCSDY